MEPEAGERGQGSSNVTSLMTALQVAQWDMSGKSSKEALQNWENIWLSLFWGILVASLSCGAFKYYHGTDILSLTELQLSKKPDLQISRSLCSARKEYWRKGGGGGAKERGCWTWCSTGASPSWPPSTQTTKPLSPSQAPSTPSLSKVFIVVTFFYFCFTHFLHHHLFHLAEVTQSAKIRGNWWIESCRPSLRRLLLIKLWSFGKYMEPPETY